MQGIKFDPQFVYTFHIRQHIVDVANYQVPIKGIGKVNLLSYLHGQPIRFMAFDRAQNEHLWNFEVRWLLLACVKMYSFSCELPVAHSLAADCQT
jgi:hypothetical protein